MPSSADATNSSSTSPYAAASPSHPKTVIFDQVASASPAAISSQAGMVALTPNDDFGSLRLKDSMSFSVMLGVIVVSFVVLRHIIARFRQSTLQHLT
jgi:hypothetical protein